MIRIKEIIENNKNKELAYETTINKLRFENNQLIEGLRLKIKGEANRKEKL
jgi:hypothetical protein